MVDTIDLSSKAICVSLGMSQWSGEKTDRAVSDKVDGDFKCKRKAGKFTKHLLSKASFKEIGRCVYDVKTLHKKMTSPWDSGFDILPSELIPDYQLQMKVMIRNFEESADRFAANYPTLLRKAEEDLKALFHRDEYPTISEVRDRFGVKLRFVPVPTSGDFRVEMADDEIEYMKQQLDKDNHLKVAKVTRHAWSQLFGVVEDMATRMEGSENFRDTAIKNVAELVAILPALNIADDPELEKIRREVEVRICSQDPKELRADAVKKKDTISAAKSLMDKMSGYMGGV